MRSLFSGLAPGFVGLYQLNITLPPDLPFGSLQRADRDTRRQQRGRQAAGFFRVLIETSGYTVPSSLGPGLVWPRFASPNRRVRLRPVRAKQTDLP